MSKHVKNNKVVSEYKSIGKYQWGSVDYYCTNRIRPTLPEIKLTNWQKIKLNLFFVFIGVVWIASAVYSFGWIFK